MTVDATSQLDPEKIKIIVATDCGSTTTKAIMIEEVDGVYRQTYRGEAPTTVEEPFADVTVGVVNSVTELQELSGRRLVTDDGTILRRDNVDDPDGCDIYISTLQATTCMTSLSFLLSCAQRTWPPQRLPQHLRRHFGGCPNVYRCNQLSQL